MVDALRLLANVRAQAVKDELTARSIGGERLFLTVPRLSSERAAPAAGNAPVAGAQTGGTTAVSASPSRVDLALR